MGTCSSSTQVGTDGITLLCSRACRAQPDTGFGAGAVTDHVSVASSSVSAHPNEAERSERFVSPPSQSDSGFAKYTGSSVWVHMVASAWGFQASRSFLLAQDVSSISPPPCPSLLRKKKTHLSFNTSSRDPPGPIPPTDSLCVSMATCTCSQTQFLQAVSSLKVPP